MVLSWGRRTDVLRLLGLGVVVLVGLTALLPATARAGNATIAHLCKKDGWKTLSRADGTPFASHGACVSYGAHGGKFGQTIQFTSTNPSPVTVGAASYTPTATATSGLPVTITLDAASTGCSLSGGVVSFTATGTCIIDANQAGSSTWAPAPQAQQSITIQTSQSSQSLCESFGGTFATGTGTTLWQCSGLPFSLPGTDVGQLQQGCFGDGGNTFSEKGDNEEFTFFCDKT